MSVSRCGKMDGCKRFFSNESADKGAEVMDERKMI